MKIISVLKYGKTWSGITLVSMTFILLTSFFSAAEQAAAQTEKDIHRDAWIETWCGDTKYAVRPQTSLNPGESKTVWCNDAKTYPNDCNPDADYCLKSGDFFLGAHYFGCNPDNTPRADQSGAKRFSDDDSETMAVGDWWEMKCLRTYGE